MVGFLLAPLLYLSRHLAQKPVHRLRWPHKRDLHRRLLAGFFYLFAALYIVGVLGMWTRWLLGRRDPWIWTAQFIVRGRAWWSRPVLISYWLLLIAASVVSWQAVVVSAKRIRVARSNPKPATEDVVEAVPAAPASGNMRATAAGVVRTLGGLGSSVGNAASATETGTVALKKAAHLSLNARRKFFHALAVLLFVPGIALDVSFSSWEAGAVLTPRAAGLRTSRVLAGVLCLHLRRVHSLLRAVPLRRRAARVPGRVHRPQGRRSRHPQPLLPAHRLCGAGLDRGLQDADAADGRARARRWRRTRLRCGPPLRAHLLAGIEQDRRGQRCICQQHLRQRLDAASRRLGG